MEPLGLRTLTLIALGALLAYAIGEMLWLTVISRRVSFRHDYSQVLKNLGAYAVFNALLPFLGIAVLATLGNRIAPFHLDNHWYLWPVALIVYEFWYWVQHWLAHKVRLLWCIHSPHHAPDTIHLGVGFNHHVFEGPYMAFFLGFLPALCGLPVIVILAINLFDVVWGNMLHASPKVVDRAYGPLERFMQTPSYHRVHHARNPRYMDTNYNSITLLWDWVLGTLQPLRKDEPVDYGITRDVDVESWRDVQFGEMKLLWRDVRAAPAVRDKLLYLLMPPGWSHTGEHNTVSVQKKALGLQAAS